MIDKSALSPCFILGAGRSGTKFLRGLLSVSEDVAAIPYDVGYVWRYGNEYFPSDEFASEMATAKITKYVRKTLPKLVPQKTSSKARILVEKSVPNTLRVAYLNAIYPEAKFIHLIRDGRAVVESSFRMWNEPPERGYLIKKLKYFPWSNYHYAVWYITNVIKGKFQSKRGQHIWGPRYNGIDEDLDRLPLERVCARQWRICVEKCLEQTEQIDPERVLEVRYEELMRDPGVLAKICKFVGIKDISPVMDFYKKEASPVHLDKWKSKVSSFNFAAVQDEVGPLLEALGYND